MTSDLGQEDEESADFLQSMMDNEEDAHEDHNSTVPASAVLESSANNPYNPKKPLWWKKISGKPTKSQKRSIVAMEGFRLPRLEWGEKFDWDAIFSSRERATEQGRETTTRKEVWFEIGFGTGDNLLAMAHKFPNRCFVGAEVHSAGLGKLCQRMHHAIEANSHWTDYDEFSEEKANCFREVDPNPPHENHHNHHDTLSLPLSSPQDSIYYNLRFFGGDGIKMLPFIATDSLRAVLVTFPDPFPKDAQAQYRVVQKHTVLEFHRILEPGGCFFLATDHEGHLEWCHQVVDLVNHGAAAEGSTRFSWVQDLDRRNWLPVISKYEQKGWNEGRSTHLSCWRATK